jgi:hypothetical protein
MFQEANFILPLTRSQLLEGPKCESQKEDNGKARSRGTLPSSQHLKGVEGVCWSSRMGLERVKSN